MHANTLRKYENEQILRPARTDGNLRLYSTEDIARLRQIKTGADVSYRYITVPVKRGRARSRCRRWRSTSSVPPAQLA